jgi:hypothetical protein
MMGKGASQGERVLQFDHHDLIIMKRSRRWRRNAIGWRDPAVVPGADRTGFPMKDPE